MGGGAGGLGEADLAALLDVVTELYRLDRIEDFPAAALAAARTLVSADAAGYNEVDPRVPSLILVTDPPSLAEEAPVERWVELSGQHPVLAHFQHERDGTARRISDFLDRDQYHALGLYQEVYRHIGCEHQVAVVLPTPEPLVVAIVLNREHQDFSDRDCAVLDALRPHLVQAFRTAQLRALVRAGTSLLDQVLAPTGVGVAFLDGAGRVLGATPAGEEMLGELAAGELAAAVQGDRHPSGAPGGDPVAQLQRRLAGAADRFDGRDRGRDPILVRYVTGLGGELDAMVMDRRHTDDLGRLQALGLTPREAEVLLHAVDGRTVAETASRLGSRPGTVRKHLERIYAKLGVSSRGAAVAQAVDALMWRPELGAPLDAQASQTPNRFRKATVVEPTSSPMDSRTAVGEGSDANRGD